MEAERDERKVCQILYFERHSPAIVRILMYAKVDQYNLARHYFQIGIMFCPKTNSLIFTCTVKKNTWYRRR